MINVFIDESGNLGKSGNYFALSAVVFDTDKGKNRVKRIIRKEQLINKQAKRTGEVKFSKLEFPERQRILVKITKRADVDIFYFVAYKPAVRLLLERKSKNLVYNYFAWMLCEKIFKKYNDDFMVIFDQRSTTVKSMNSLTDYIKLNAYMLPNLVEKNVFVNQADSKTNYLLQAADVMAGAVYHSYTKGASHFLDIMNERILDLEEFPRGKFRMAK